MMIKKCTPSVNQDYWLKRVNTQLNANNQSKYTEVSKVVKSTNKNTLLQNFWDWSNIQPIVPSLPDYCATF